MNAAAVARRLNDNQSRTICDLKTDSPTILGCAEKVAYRMSFSNLSRPPLTISHGEGKFSLTDAGKAVQDAILEMEQTNNA